jgi:hypothetical protein
MLTRDDFFVHVIDFDEENKHRPMGKQLQPHVKEITVWVELEYLARISKHELTQAKVDLEKRTIEMVRREMWLRVYGSLVDKLNEIQAAVMSANYSSQYPPSTSVDPILKKIRDMREMLAPPKEKA